MGTVALAAAALAAFNLTCTGVVTTKSMQPEETKPYSHNYRLDLEANKWCEGDCKSTWPIYKVDPGYITLEEPRTVDTVSESYKSRGVIDRVKGTESILTSGGKGALFRFSSWNGVCTKGTFSGFPKPVTKF